MIPHALEKKVFDNNIPLDVQIELTWKCNHRCLHCYQYPPSDNELSAAEIKDIISQLADAGCLYLAFTGGEPLLRKDIWEIADFAFKKHFALTLQTNGTLIGEKEADKIAGFNFFVVHISILGSKADTHDRVTGVKGSFEKVVKAAKLLNSRGVKVILNHTMMKENYGEYDGIKKLNKELGCNVDMRVSPFIFMSSDGSAEQEALRLDDDQLKEFYRAMRGEIGGQELQNKALLCNFGKCSCCINAEGKVYPCVAVPLPAGDLRKEKFKDIWQNSPLFGKIRTVTCNELEECGKCDLAGWCFRCSGFSYQETGELFRGSKEARRFARIIREVSRYEKEKV